MGHADERLNVEDTFLKQFHLEMPALQVFLEKTAIRMKEMNLAAR